MLYLFFFAIVVVVVMITHDPATRLCRWRKDRSRDRDGKRFWTCDYCGAQTLTDGPPPRQCQRQEPPR